jgi:hypothetical protein
MCMKEQRFFILSSCTLLLLPSLLQARKADNKDRASAEITADQRPVLWRNPVDISTRDLFFGPGGKEHQPKGVFVFVKEDLDGTTPKIVVRDRDGVKWKAKLGSEARPEVVASRLTWAAGYFANEDYFVLELRVEGLPPHLHRGQKYFGQDGSFHNVRLKRYNTGEEKEANWSWKDAVTEPARELNGLRVLMALMNNWDLTDENNAIYEEHADGGAARIHMVSDVGSTFGSGNLAWPLRKSRGNLQTYSHSRFITHVTPEYVDFHAPARASFFFLFTPYEYAHKLQLRWIGRHIPRTDAHWLGQLLAQLSPNQIRDAFRAAGYSAPEVEGFAKVVESRIAELEEL